MKARYLAGALLAIGAGSWWRGQASPSVPLLRPLWTFTPGPGGVDHPLVDAGRVYVMYRKDSESSAPSVHLYALDLVSGKQIWERTIVVAGRFRSQGRLTEGLEPLASGGRVYFVSSDEHIHALEGGTGRELWQSGPVFSLLAVTGDSLFTLDQKQSLTVMDGATGRVRQQTTLRGDEVSRALIADGKLFLSSSTVQVFDLRTFAPLWTFAEQTQGWMRVGLHVEGGRAYIDTGHDIYGLEAASGKRLWRYPAASPVQAIDGDRLYYTDSDGKTGRQAVHVLDSRTGALRGALQIADFQATRYGALTAGGGLLYVTVGKPHNAFSGVTNSRDSALCAVDGATGQKVWCSPWQYEYLQQAVYADGLALIGGTGEGGRPSSLYSFRATDTHTAMH